MFPRDHGAHRAYRTEWWYYTGNLATRDERRFGFELTFFRIALAPQAPVSRSAWASNQIWMAHLAVSDIAAKRFVAEQRLSRGALGLAGATAQPFKVWVEDWSAAGRLGARNGAIRLQARGKKAAIDLDLSAVQPPVPEGNAGLDPKGPEPGNASYYYSIPRLAVTGTVEPPDGSSERVHGLAWMDREWSSSALGPDITGWDWFGLQLADGRDLMFYRLRTAQGGASSFSGGSLIEPDGSRRRLGAKDVETAPLRRWRSPASGVEYPVAWRLRTAAGAGDLDLHVEPALEDQELRLAVRYWEGAVRVSGTAAGKPISGRGYLELAGYR
jgi:predicted secreted hydrolase